MNVRANDQQYFRDTELFWVLTPVLQFFFCKSFTNLAPCAAETPLQPDQTRWTPRSGLQKPQWPQRRSFIEESESIINIKRHKKASSSEKNIVHSETPLGQKEKVKVIVLSTFRSTRKPALQKGLSQTCGAAGNRGTRDYLRTGCTRCGRRASQSWTIGND